MKRRGRRELTDAELDGGSRLPGWPRRHVVAHVGYNARAIARLIEWAATGVETLMYFCPVDPGIIAGPLPAVVTWAGGRGSRGVTATGASDGIVPAPPKWV